MALHGPETPSNIKQVKRGTRGNSWWISFTVEDENVFCGQILHIHAETPEVLRDIVQDYLAWIGAAGSAAGALGLALGPVAALPALGAVAWKAASNRDGSYDFYKITEKKSRWRKWAAAIFPSSLVDFTGFVSDQAHKPPIGLSTHVLLTLPIFEVPRIKAVANKFRYQPKP